MRKEIDSASEVRLPSGATSYADFLARYRFYKIVVAKLSKKVQDLQEPMHGSEAEQRARHTELKQTETLLRDARTNLDVYTRAKEGYLNQAEFYGVAGLFTRKRPLAIGLAVLAAIGALGFQLALASAPQPPKGPQIAYLISPERENEFWRALGLTGCEVGSKVPVTISGGVGSDDDPYKVTVLSSDDRCAGKSFDVRSDVVTVEKVTPREVTVHYQH
jgi:hypothetical protein